ncbi:hypothetical protein BDA96_01G259200 [Sorghum bicolor]|uniref:Uncharacterized protein n=2 Tax=Sorghum bicolor TaxID=4558 RepID=A0A921UYG9_SORBI|nr:hypothetical protein BDA96_01G259200 [Sorghum bicolor]OQU91765.1 hypothetical protein SORBI_3001G244650 [Sorghum bicolor]
MLWCRLQDHVKNNHQPTIPTLMNLSRIFFHLHPSFLPWTVTHRSTVLLKGEARRGAAGPLPLVTDDSSCALPWGCHQNSGQTVSKSRMISCLPQRRSKLARGFMCILSFGL